jgi:maleate cis-trans isomerase
VGEARERKREGWWLAGLNVTGLKTTVFVAPYRTGSGSPGIDGMAESGFEGDDVILLKLVDNGPPERPHALDGEWRWGI